MEFSLDEKLESAISRNQSIKMRAYAMLPATEADLNNVIVKILERHNRPDLLTTIYTCVKELAVNGAKANIKRIMFEEENVNIENEADYKRGIEIFKTKLTEKFVAEYARIAKEKNLYVDIIFDYNENRLILEVINNSALSQKEDLRIREKFRSGSKYDNIGDFYMEMQDNQEGAGMGITLILMMLKSENIDPHYFTIKSDYKTKTVAKLVFPFTQDYVSGRQEYASAEN